jgi:hypothetical protein
LLRSPRSSAVAVIGLVAIVLIFAMILVAIILLGAVGPPIVGILLGFGGLFSGSAGSGPL